MMLQNPHNIVPVDQWAIAAHWLNKRAAERRHLTMYLSGAHAYGFPSPDSDLDIKCVHIANTAHLLAITPHDDGLEVTEIVDGVEVDYSSHELGMVVRGVISGNGNYLERLLGPTMFATDDELVGAARDIITGLLSQRVANHYAGFASSQLKLFDVKPTAKRALYVLRTAATGRALLGEARMVTDVRQLLHLCPAGIDELLAIKQLGETEALSPAMATAWRTRLAAAIAELEPAKQASILPATPTDGALRAANDWLLAVRRANF